jgi:SAM-dependent methyltransferase
MTKLPCLPEAYYERLRELEASYLSHSDPLQQSGYGGGSINWRKKRGVVLEAVDGNGTFLDVGCANGYLLECLVPWAQARGVRLSPYGLDIGERLIYLAQQRLPHWADRFFVGNIWDWEPPRQFHYVSTSLCVPEAYKKILFDKLVTRIVEPGGRLILRCYYKQTEDGSRREYFDNQAFLMALGMRPAGSVVSDPPGAEYVWIDC